MASQTSTVSKLAANYRHLSFVGAVVLGGAGLYLLGAHGLAALVWGLGTFVGALPFGVSMVRSLVARQFGVDLIAIVAIASALLLGQYFAAAVILLMLTGGEALERYAQVRAQKELGDLLERAPKIAHKLINGIVHDVAVNEIVPGDMLQILPGEVAPVDGVVRKGRSSFDESAITGESLPVEKSSGDSVVSGSVNDADMVVVEATHTSKESQYAQIIALVREAALSRAPLVRLADRYSGWFTGIAFGLAAVGWLLTGKPITALEVLVVATPCPLLLATPVALVSGMSRAARTGIIMKNGSALERLSHIKTLAFDKTGTLTEGVPTIEKITALKDSQNDLLALAASVEASSNHVLAQAVVTEARRRKLELVKISSLHEESGRGVTAKVGKQRIVIGRSEFLVDHGIEVPKKLVAEDPSHTTIVIGRGDEAIGSITFQDRIRTEATATLKGLRELGLSHTLMLTGDHKQVAQRIAKQLGITDVRADCLPADKVQAIQALPPRMHPVGMIGDGVNDAPTLAAADVGIALGAKGSTAASQSADVVIMLDDLSKMRDAVVISRHAMTIAKQSIFIGIGLSVLLMLVATTGKILPVYGAGMQELIDVGVILNALRARSS